jgi:hypothetical protein
MEPMLVPKPVSTFLFLKFSLSIHKPFSKPNLSLFAAHFIFTVHFWCDFLCLNSSSFAFYKVCLEIFYIKLRCVTSDLFGLHFQLKVFSQGLKINRFAARMMSFL